jgi:AraC-like DNA-binding protein
VDRPREGLKLTAIDLTLESSLEARFVAEPSIFMGVVLDGHMEVGSSHERVSLPSVAATTTIIREPVAWYSRALCNGRLRVLHTVVTPGWLETVGIPPPSFEHVAAFVTKMHPVSAQLAALAVDTINRPFGDCPIQALRREAAALLFVATFADHCWAAERNPSVVTHRNRRRMSEALEVLEAQAKAEGPLPPLASLARQAGMSPSTLCRVFHQARGESVCSYLIGVKLDVARRKLEHGEVTIAQAAHDAGYGSSANFITAFKRRFGVAPGAVTTGKLPS